jgi:BMFP domain-containing protein YqiC
MASSSASELFSTLKGYINQLSDGDRSPSEVASAFNEWARDSAESIKSKVAEEVEASVVKMGFIKRAEFDALLARVESLEAALADKVAASESAGTKRKSTVRKFSVRNAAPDKILKKSTAKKNSEAKSAKVKGVK